MPDNTSQSVSSVSYQKTVSSTTTVVLANELVSRINPATNTATVEFWQTLDPTAAAKQDTINVSGTMALNDQAWIRVVDADANAAKYILEAQAGMTLAQILAELTSYVNVDDDVTATFATGVSTGTITVTSATPGRAFTVTVGVGGSNTGTVAIGTITNVVANAAGSNGSAPKKRKLAEVDVVYGPSSDGFLTATNNIRFYTGASVPAVAQNQSSSPYKHPSSIGTIQSNQGF